MILNIVTYYRVKRLLCYIQIIANIGQKCKERNLGEQEKWPTYY